MDDKESPDPGAEFGSDSSWTLGAESDTGNYFLTCDRESSILSEFGWNLQPEHASEPLQVGDLDRLEPEERPDLAGNLGFAPESRGGGFQGSGASLACAVGSVSGCDLSTSNPSFSSSSSEDPAEKSTGSGGKPPEIP